MEKLCFSVLSILGLSIFLKSPANALEVPNLYFWEGEARTISFSEDFNYPLNTLTNSTSKISYRILSGSDKAHFISQDSLVLDSVGELVVEACVSENKTFTEKCATQTINIIPGKRVVLVEDEEDRPAFVYSYINLYKIEDSEIPESDAKNLKLNDFLDENLKKSDETSAKYQISSIETSVENSDKYLEKYVGYGSECVVRGNYCERDAHTYQKIHRTVTTTTIFKLKNLNEFEPETEKDPSEIEPNSEETPSDSEENTKIVPFVPEENLPDSFEVLPKLTIPNTGVLPKLSENSIEFRPNFNILVLNFFLFSIISLRILYKNRL